MANVINIRTMRVSPMIELRFILSIKVCYLCFSKTPCMSGTQCFCPCRHVIFSYSCCIVVASLIGWAWTLLPITLTITRIAAVLVPEVFFFLWVKCWFIPYWLGIVQQIILLYHLLMRLVFRDLRPQNSIIGK